MNDAVPRMAVTQRNLMQLLPITAVTQVAANNPDSFLGVGSFYHTTALDFSLRQFLTSTSGLVTVYDQYRFDLLEVYAFLDNFQAGAPMYITSSVDYDDAVVGDWYTMSQRNNTKTVVLNSLKPYRMIGAFTPRGNFVTQGTDSPSNMVPQSNQFWDLANLTQLFNGIKLHASSQYNGSVRYYAKARISFRGKI